MRGLFLTADLMFGSSLAGAAQRAERQVQIVSTCEALEEQANKRDAALVILDLSLPGLDVTQLVAHLRTLLPAAAKIVAYAPHVHTAKLEAAQTAGCDEVLTRGQFNSQMDRLLANYLF